MDFNLSDADLTRRAHAAALGARLTERTPATDVVRRAIDAGLVHPDAGLLAAATVIEALAAESADAGLVLALHLGVALGAADTRLAARLAGGGLGAMALSTEQVPVFDADHLDGRAVWVGPLSRNGVAVLGALVDGVQTACAVGLGDAGVRVEPLTTAALRGWTCGHLVLERAPCDVLGSTRPFMARARVLLASVGLGMGRRALREALESARGLRGRGAGGEQTAQGLLADAATELDAAMLLIWKAASAPALSLGDASMAKLAATEAAQRAVSRATQVVGADAFRLGHVLERLAQDVRALDLLAGRTEALREAVADEHLPRV
jgi:alkylation response protein AidB-like acyl-CoA dehydrogenase